MVKLDDTLILYEDLIQKMGVKVRAMYELALEIVETGDREKALNLIQADEFINRFEEEINDQGQDALALLSPVATDLRVILAGIKTANDLERIGDYAKNIARYVIKNGSIPPVILSKVKEIGRLFLIMFEHTMTAYKKRDVQAAYMIAEEDEKINALMNEILEELNTALKSGTEESMDFLIPTIALLRNFERSGDHAKNILEHLIYLEKGQHVDFG